MHDVSKFKMQIGKCGCDALRAPTETGLHLCGSEQDEAAALSCSLYVLHLGKSFEEV